MSETGAVKFHYESSGAELAPFPGFEELNAARQELRRLGLLGVDESGIGFGNVSLRDGAAFYITGSGTGVLYSLGPAGLREGDRVGFRTQLAAVRGPGDCLRGIAHPCGGLCDGRRNF